MRGNKYLPLPSPDLLWLLEDSEDDLSGYNGYVQSSMEQRKGAGWLLSRETPLRKELGTEMVSQPKLDIVAFPEGFLSD